MIKPILLSSILIATLCANEIQFENAAKQPKHRLPHGKNEILSFNEILKNSMNSVVNISTKTIVQTPLNQDPFFQEFFGSNQQRTQPSEKKDNALGSGVIVSKDGYIITNNHVIIDADEIDVTINGSDKIYVAKVIGKDKGSDLAVIKIEAKNLQPISLGHIEDLKLGDVVFAVGNPFGVGQTVTQGIISAMNKDHVGINKYENFIQTDASINPGNSGGALIDSRGALIGINAAILSQTGGNHGIGFSIPIDMVRNVVQKIITTGKVSRGYMGVNISKVTQELKVLYIHQKGAIITDVQANSPSEKAKLLQGDLIYAVNGKNVKGPNDLQRYITALNPDEVITLSIERNKKNISKKLSLSSLEKGEKLSHNYIEIEGLRLSELSKKIRHEFKIPNNITGVFIEGVLERSQADSSGFEAGDILIQIESQQITNLNEAKNAFTQLKGEVKRVYVNRGDLILLIITK